MGKRTAGQLPLDDVAAPKKKGTTERAAETDLTAMRKAGTVGESMKALEASYRLAAREVDRAEEEKDRWGKLKAMSELRALRERLAPMSPAASSGDLLDKLRAAIRDAQEA